MISDVLKYPPLCAARVSPGQRRRIESGLSRSIGGKMSDTLSQIVEKLYDGKNIEVAELTQQALDEGLTAAEILNGGLVAGMDRVGVDFKNGDLFVPEVLIAARAMHAGMDILRPLLAESDVPSAGKIVVGTVAGDLHDIGKNLVAMMLEGGGFEVVDVGIDTTPEKFVEAIKTEQPDLVGLSALLTTTMPAMQRTIDALVEAGLRASVKVMVGGAPVTQGFADEIGADGYAPDAASAVDLARALMA
jgi:5-methyltetrahydrofolate--homocysteine methyltransferase